VLATRSRAEPDLASAVLLVLVGLLVVGSLGMHQARLLQVAFPAVCLVAGMVLFGRSPAGYLTFVMWLWALAPLVRRLAEWQLDEFNDQNLILLSPYIVTAIAGVALFRRPGVLNDRRTRPFVIGIGCVAAGAVVGLAKVGLQAAIFGFLEWSTPIALGGYVATLSVARLEHAWRTVWRHALVLLVVVGCYGVYQFFAILPWDVQWMDNAPIGSIGQPKPFEVRVFSTANAPGVLSMIVMVLLLLALGRRSAMKLPITVLAGVVLGVSLVRSAWLGVAVGVVAFWLLQRGRSRSRSILAALLIVPLFLGVTQAGPINAVLSTRASSFGELGEDDSLNARFEFFRETLPGVLANPIGHGTGSSGATVRTGVVEDDQAVQAFDNGLLAIPFALGLLPGLVYFGVLVNVTRQVVGGSRGGRRMRRAAAAAWIAGLVQLLFVFALAGATGAFIWMAAGLGIAAKHARPSAAAPEDAELAGAHE
jgi:hypothetical protein